MKQRRRARTASRLSFAVFFLLVAACRGAPQEAAPGVEAHESHPALDAHLLVSPAAHDFGRVVQGELLHAGFELTNGGPAALHLSESRALGCVGRPSPELLEPGARARLEVTCETQYFGPLRVTLPILARGAEARAELQLTAAVTPRLNFDTPLLELSIPFGEVRTADVQLVGALAQQAKLELEDSGDVHFRLEPLPTTSRQPGLRLRVKGDRVGNFVGTLRFATHVPNPAQVTLPYSCKVLGSLSVTPTTPYFDLAVAGPKQVIVSVRSTQPGFRVSAARILEGPFQVSFSPGAQPGEYRVQLQLRENRVSEEARSAQGRVLIESNDRTEPRKELPLFGFGRLNREAPPG